MVLGERTLVVHLLDPVGPFPGPVHDGLVQFGRKDGCEVDFGQAGVFAGQVVQFHVFLGIHHVGHLGDVLAADVAVIRERGAAFLALFGGDQHDTVRSTGTVDGGRGGVLQNVDGFDIVGVQGIDVTAGHAVDDVERLGVTDSADTTDIDFVSTSRLTGALGDGDTRALALEGGDRGGRAEFGEFVTLYLDGRAGDEFLLLDTVTDDDRLVQLVEFRIERDIDRSTALNGNLLFGVSQDSDRKGPV